MPIKLAILLSGRGSNMQAIHRAILDKKLDATIAMILSDQPEAKGIEYARERNIPVAVFEKQPGQKREAFDQILIEKIQSLKVDYVVLAGYMRLLSPKFIQAFAGRIVNIHPSLLPAFPGLHAQRQAIAAKVKESGCTVHFVDEGCDTGPIIAQRRISVLPGDTEESLAERILAQEHQLYSECLQALAAGKIRLEGNRVVKNQG